MRDTITKEKKRGTEKRRYVLLLFTMLMLLMMTFTACGGGGDEAGDGADAEAQAEESAEEAAPAVLSEKVDIVYTKNMAFAALVLKALGETDNYHVYTVSSESKAVRELTSGKADFAILSPTRAAEEYKDDKSVRLVSPLFAGGYRFRGDSANLYKAYVAPAEGSDPLDEDAWTPQSLRSSTLNLAGNTDELSLIANAVLAMDGGTVYGTVVQETYEDLSAVLKMYNQFTLVNVCQLKGAGRSVGDLEDLVNVDSIWEKKVGTPLPAAVLVVSPDFLSEREAEMDVVLSDYEKAFDKTEQPYKKGRLIFYGSSDRGKTVMESYYETIYTGENENLIPKDGFYCDL